MTHASDPVVGSGVKQGWQALNCSHWTSQGKQPPLINEKSCFYTDIFSYKIHKLLGGNAVILSFLTLN